MTTIHRSTVVGALLLFGAAGCADLDVRNPNDPDRAIALANPTDVQALVSGGYHTWTNGNWDNDLLPVSTMSFQTSAPWNNFGMVPLSQLPRVPLVNNTADLYHYPLIDHVWTQNYRAIAAVAQGLQSIEDPSTGIAESLGAEQALLTRAFGRFVQAIGHASIAVFYDQGFVIDETVDVSQPQEAVPYTEMMAAAIGYFDEAIQLSKSGSFNVPENWMGAAVTSAELAEIAHSMRAAYRASLPRTPEERSLVDWNAVLADVAAGVTADWMYDGSDAFYNSHIGWGGYPTWHQLAMPILGMADQSGNYQKWLATPVADRTPIIDGEDILIVTPDLRYAQGTTVAEQKANQGKRWGIPRWLASQWKQPARGTWRWSYYYNYEYAPYAFFQDTDIPGVTDEEMRLLAAEAHYWLGNLEEAADLINVSRVGIAELNPADAAGTNTSCVPKLPNGQCGDLLEMIKWEKRNEVWLDGIVMNNAWFFDARRWGDHYLGTPLHFPIPAQDLQVLGMEVYTFGGPGGEFASDGSTYALPGEM